MTQGPIHEYDLKLEELMRNPDRYQEWVRNLRGQAAVQTLRRELEERRAERLSQQGWLERLTTRVFGPMLADPIEVMFGSRENNLRTER